MRTLLFCLLSAAISLTLAADNPAELGQLSDVTGAVYYHENGGVQASRVEQPGLTIHVGDQFRSKRESSALFRLLDDSRVMLGAESIITFNDAQEIRAGKGITIYDIRKQQSLKGLRITSKTATIGVKGTRLALQLGGGNWLCYMDEGAVSITTTNADFKYYGNRTSTTADPADYTMVREFELTAGNAVNISNGEVHFVETPDNIRQLFKQVAEQ